jgi:hypothetical protein
MPGVLRLKAMAHKSLTGAPAIVSIEELKQVSCAGTELILTGEYFSMSWTISLV